MDHSNDAEEFCRHIWYQYLVERRYDILTDVIAPDISVIGTGAHETSRNLDEFIQAMSHESMEWDGTFLIKSQWYQTTRLSDELYLVIGELIAKENAEDGILYDVRFRFSMVLRYDGGDRWKIVHVHQSIPDPNQARDEFFPHRMIEQNGQQIIYNLRHDSMTGLLNRLYLTETVNRFMADNPQGHMLMMDIDNFKAINDHYGHPFGDKVLITLSQSLKTSFPQAAIGRVGGDEFVVYLHEFGESRRVEQALQAFLADWRESQHFLQVPGEIHVSIGVSQCPRDGNTYESVWQKADEALYKAKQSGKNTIYFVP